MRTVSLGLARSWEELEKLVTEAFDLPRNHSVTVQANATYQHKVSVIKKLQDDLPRRQYLMFGDSGELDPEVYDTIRGQVPYSKPDKAARHRLSPPGAERTILPGGI